jgi:hypothetical protein
MQCMDLYVCVHQHMYVRVCALVRMRMYVCVCARVCVETPGL